MLCLKPKTTMTLSDPYLTQAEVVTILLFDLTKQQSSGSKVAKEAANAILPMLAARKFTIEKTTEEGEETLRVAFVDYSIPEVDDDFRRYCVDFYVEDDALDYVVYNKTTPVISDYWTVSELQQITNVHIDKTCDVHH